MPCAEVKGARSLPRRYYQRDQSDCYQLVVFPDNSVILVSYGHLIADALHHIGHVIANAHYGTDTPHSTISDIS
eukprot:3941005-Rhodomonas_salina.1